MLNVAVRIPSVKESNLFLRALWAKLRQAFGILAWQYTPYKDGSKNRIFLGFAQLGNIEIVLQVFVSYEQKGVIKSIYFEPAEGYTLSTYNKSILKKAVSESITNYHNLKPFEFKTYFKSTTKSLDEYEGDHFALRVQERNLNCLTMRINGFDETDAKSQAKQLFTIILDFLSVCTNSCYIPTPFDDAPSGGSIALSETKFLEDLDWIDGTPIFDDYLRIGRVAVKFLDRILIGRIEYDDAFLRACSHFHTAQKLRFEGDYETYSELIGVLFISALEVIADSKFSDPTRCSACGQMMFSVRKNVRSLVRLYTNEHVERLIDSMYALRSKYLHVGILSTPRTFAGNVLPMLDPESESGCIMGVPQDQRTLGEFTGYILRKAFLETWQNPTEDETASAN